MGKRPAFAAFMAYRLSLYFLANICQISTYFEALSTGVDFLGLGNPRHTDTFVFPIIWALT
jgi:hypothetical protein